MSDLNNSSAYMFLLSHFLRLIDCKCTLMALKLKTFMFYLFALTETDTFYCQRQKGRETIAYRVVYIYIH